MGMRMTLEQERNYERQVDQLRALVNGMPRFELQEIDGRPVVVDSRLGDEGVQIRIEGSGQLEACRYLVHINYYALIKLLGLLDSVRGTKAHGHAACFLDALRLDEALGISER
ncbi:hypothetical protein C8D87_11347 [Lentzea atacamensis]|uniref:Uncharacterized protein n=2 Tax=Lentzea atacamensis TaxID=531938 RepID=A0ABX9DWT0_9PSEU|nr:hypothetical protein C8D87_11347 [Lentzea atacamensis]